MNNLLELSTYLDDSTITHLSVVMHHAVKIIRGSKVAEKLRIYFIKVISVLWGDVAVLDVDEGVTIHM